MAKLKFDDGVEIDVDGEFRTLKLRDGWYVRGNGVLLPAIDKAEADEMVAMLNNINPDNVVFVIKDKDSDLYWNNSLGWCDKESATTFTHDEHNQFNLPIGGEWEVRA